MAEKKSKEKIKEEIEVNIFDSHLVPKHEILSDEEKKKFLEEWNVSIKQLPRIRNTDSVVKILNAKKGDILRISRNDPAIGEYYYHRVIV